VGKPLLLVLFKRSNYITDLDEIWYEVCPGFDFHLVNISSL